MRPSADEVVAPYMVPPLRSEPHARSIVDPQTSSWLLLLRNFSPRDAKYAPRCPCRPASRSPQQSRVAAGERDQLFRLQLEHDRPCLPSVALTRIPDPSLRVCGCAVHTKRVECLLETYPRPRPVSAPASQRRVRGRSRGPSRRDLMPAFAIRAILRMFSFSSPLRGLGCSWIALLSAVIHSFASKALANQ